MDELQVGDYTYHLFQGKWHLECVYGEMEEVDHPRLLDEIVRLRSLLGSIAWEDGWRTRSSRGFILVTDKKKPRDAFVWAPVRIGTLPRGE